MSQHAHSRVQARTVRPSASRPQEFLCPATKTSRHFPFSAFSVQPLALTATPPSWTPSNPCTNRLTFTLSLSNHHFPQAVEIQLPRLNGSNLIKPNQTKKNFWPGPRPPSRSACRHRSSCLERFSRTISRIEPMNHSQIQRRAIAKTRKPILPLLGGEGRGEGELLYTNFALRFMEMPGLRVSVKPFKYSAFYARKPTRPDVPLFARRRSENVPARRWRWNSRPGLES